LLLRLLVELRRYAAKNDLNACTRPNPAKHSAHHAILDNRNLPFYETSRQ
jgi:hypothetical protein